jgi:hypothetical protein
MADNNRKGTDRASRNFFPRRAVDEEVPRQSDRSIQAERQCRYASLDWSQGALLDFLASQQWHHYPATQPQIEALRKRGYDPPEDVTRGQASHVLDRPSPK